MKNLFFFSLVILLSLTACDKDDVIPPRPPEQNIPEPDDIPLTHGIKMPQGAQYVKGQVPAPSLEGAPTVTVSPSNILSTNGVTAPIQLSYKTISGNLGGCYVQVSGAPAYYKIPYKGPSSSSGVMSLTIGVYPNLDQGHFYISCCVYDTNGKVSQADHFSITVL